MKKLYIPLFFVLLLGCTKKAVEQAQTNIVIQAMTSGQWKVTSFTRAGTDVTASFSPYLFQFNTNLTVDAINGGTVEKTGSWNADATAQTISSNFTNASDPLDLLNGTWAITNNSWTWVQASQTVNGEYRTLRLDKQ